MIALRSTTRLQHTLDSFHVPKKVFIGHKVHGNFEIPKVHMLKYVEERQMVSILDFRTSRYGFASFGY